MQVGLGLCMTGGNRRRPRLLSSAGRRCRTSARGARTLCLAADNFEEDTTAPRSGRDRSGRQPLPGAAVCAHRRRHVLDGIRCGRAHPSSDERNVHRRGDWRHLRGQYIRDERRTHVAPLALPGTHWPLRLLQPCGAPPRAGPRRLTGSPGAAPCRRCDRRARRGTGTCSHPGSDNWAAVALARRFEVRHGRQSLIAPVLQNLHARIRLCFCPCAIAMVLTSFAFTRRKAS